MEEQTNGKIDGNNDKQKMENIWEKNTYPNPKKDYLWEIFIWKCNLNSKWTLSISNRKNKNIFISNRTQNRYKRPKSMFYIQREQKIRNSNNCSIAVGKNSLKTRPIYTSNLNPFISCESHKAPSCKQQC